MTWTALQLTRWRTASLGLVLFAFFMTSAALADVLILADGTRLEGSIRRTADGYSVTAADGTVTNVLASKVAGFQLKGEAAGGTTADVRLQSLRRSVANLAELDLIISKYESFITQNEGTPAAEQAQVDLDRWRDFKDRGLIKHGADWVMPAERDRRLRDAFLEVSDARLQIKNRDFERARRTLQRLLQADPTDISALYLTGVLDLEEGDIPKARASFDKVRAQERSHAPTLVNLAALDMSQDRHQRALTLLAEALNSAPGNREILDNAAEALNLLPPKMASSRQADTVRQLFLSQDAALRQSMAERGLYRWGSTWVDRQQLEELQALEKEINARIEELSGQYQQLEREIADIDQRYETNRIYMQRLEANRTMIGSDGKVYQTPLPPAYFEAERENQLMLQQRQQKLGELAVLDQQAAQERARYPTPPFKNKLSFIGEDGVPVRLPPGGLDPAAMREGERGVDEPAAGAEAGEGRSGGTEPSTRPAGRGGQGR